MPPTRSGPAGDRPVACSRVGARGRLRLRLRCSLSIVVAKFANSFSEPACQQAVGVPLVFSSTPWTLYAYLRRHHTDVSYLELPIDASQNPTALNPLRHQLDKGSILVLCGGLWSGDDHNQNQRAACRAARESGARTLLLGFHEICSIGNFDQHKFAHCPTRTYNEEGKLVSFCKNNLDRQRNWLRAKGELGEEEAESRPLG